MLADELHECVDIWEARVIYKLDDFKRTEELIKRANSSYLVRAFEAAININSNPTKALQITETFDLRNPASALPTTYFEHIYSAMPPHPNLLKLRRQSKWVPSMAISIIF